MTNFEFVPFVTRIGLFQDLFFIISTTRVCMCERAFVYAHECLCLCARTRVCMRARVCVCLWHVCERSLGNLCCIILFPWRLANIVLCCVFLVLKSSQLLENKNGNIKWLKVITTNNFYIFHIFI